MDERARHLERSAAQGDVGARAALLRERLRAGALRVERLRLAAFLRDEAAALALGDPHAGQDDPALELATWLMALATGFGQEVAVRAALAAARFERPAWSQPTLVGDPVPDAIRAAEGWLACPCEACAAAAGQAAAPANRVPRRHLAFGDDDDLEEAFTLAGLTACRLAAAAAWCAANAAYAPEILRNAAWNAEAAHAHRVREAVRAALVEWALG